MEMAFILPILLILVLGVIEIGRYAYIAILVGNAARAGAAYGAQNKQLANDSTGIQNAAQYDFAGSASSNNTPPPATNGLAATNIWNDTFVSELAPYSTLRFMDWGNTNHSKIVTWSQRDTE